MIDAKVARQLRRVKKLVKYTNGNPKHLGVSITEDLREKIKDLAPDLFKKRERNIVIDLEKGECRYWGGGRLLLHQDGEITGTLDLSLVLPHAISDLRKKAAVLVQREIEGERIRKLERQVEKRLNRMFR